MTEILVTGRLYSPAVVFTLMLRTRPSVPGCTSITLPIVHLPWIASLSAITTVSLTPTFRLSLCYAYFVTTAGSASLLQRFQKETTIFCTNSTRGRRFSVSFVSCCSFKEHVVRTQIFAFMQVIWNTADLALIYEISDF